MKALRMALAATLAVLALAAVGCGSDDEDAADDTTATLTETTETDTTDTGSAIKGTVGPAFDISVDQTSVTAGSYELEVEDLSDIHNFHLTGPGESMSPRTSPARAPRASPSSWRQGRTRSSAIPTPGR